MKQNILKLKQTVDISAGHAFRGKITEVAGAGVYVVNVKDVSLDAGIDWSRCIETEISSKREPDWLQPGDILFTGRGSHNFAVLVDAAITNCTQNGRGAVAAPHFYVARITNQHALPEYLVWFLNQQPCQRYFQRESEGSLTKSIRRSVLENTPLAMPAMTTQLNIVQLARNIQHQQHTAEQFIRNGKTVMNAIANDLLKNA